MSCQQCEGKIGGNRGKNRLFFNSKWTKAGSNMSTFVKRAAVKCCRGDNVDYNCDKNPNLKCKMEARI